jgi:hypothetical protein
VKIRLETIYFVTAVDYETERNPVGLGRGSVKEYNVEMQTIPLEL